ncbi:hypothetical protein KY331_04585 [Candidatus Woesearchaeota archaeon]|nr:hypothetical protein [Candidatus Woesearchaeota archaeon]
MGLVAKLEGKSNISLSIVQERKDGVLEFYIEAHYKNGGEGAVKSYLHGPIMVNDRGHPVVHKDVDEDTDYLAIAQNLIPDQTIDTEIIPQLLKALKDKLKKLKQGNIQFEKVGNYTPEELEEVYASLHSHAD